MKTIATNDGEIFLVSDEDYDYLMQWSWSSNRREAAFRNEHPNKKFLMHHEILRRMGHVDFEEGDHKDRNRFNNQRENLRPATKSQNRANRTAQANNTTGYKGVHFDKQSRNYRATIRHNKVTLQLGCFENPEQAALAYNRAAKRIFGEFAALNENIPG